MSGLSNDWTLDYNWSTGIYDTLHHMGDDSWTLVYCDTDPLPGLKPWDSAIGNEFVTRILHIGLAATALGNILSSGTAGALVEEVRVLRDENEELKEALIGESESDRKHGWLMP